ncbi:MAG TPA: tail tape measure protein [Sphingobium sp.]|nr:tail tape measure protein [Sphingobium sp.]
MDDELDGRTVAVRADVARFAQDIGEMRSALEGPLVAGADKAGRAIEAGLLRAVRNGKLGFDDLGKMALSTLAQIAAAAVRQGVGAMGLGGGGLLGLGTSLLAGALGLPGRATGGPVSPGRGYLVGERGPEMFMPTSSGQVVPVGGAGAGREVHVSITVNSGGADSPRALARSARQVARAVRGALGD